MFFRYTYELALVDSPSSVACFPYSVNLKAHYYLLSAVDSILSLESAALPTTKGSGETGITI